MKRHALITGVTGQDGAYLSRYLLEKDYVVFGLVPRSTRYAFANLDYLGVTGDVDFIDGDLADEASPNSRGSQNSPGGGLQSGGAVLRWNVVGSTDVDHRRQCVRHAATS